MNIRGEVSDVRAWRHIISREGGGCQGRAHIITYPPSARVIVVVGEAGGHVHVG
jgi:hypothetical protein